MLADERMRELFREHARMLRGAALALVILGVTWTASARGLATALLVVAAGALLVVIALVWSSVQSLTGEAPLTLDDALGMAAPRAEEEQKRAVLRALKDLEYERSVGKITEEDYAVLSARYRQQAKELLRSLDESLAPSRERAASLVEKRLAGSDEASAKPKKRKKKSVQRSAVVEPADGAETEPQTPDEDDAAEARRCLECDVVNELDARFCKGCGKPLEPRSDA